MPKPSIYVNDEAAEAFRNHILDILKLLGLTQAVFCEHAGVTRQMLHSWVKRKHDIRPATFYGMMYVLLDLATESSMSVVYCLKARDMIKSIIELSKTGGFKGAK